ncbi:unnamed protein product [Rotaria sordida]|uniref:KY-like immunoglobulin-like domain-containing protein n=1 Tax=Rotaria sordida TaxID=392033 RepID=A0A818UBY8_9BILA|nr:unnamed protein product [Rotaria sordida]CAF3693921.1 unnamed protein product [Rotaria sordida]CAF3835611.1 unnamed protein product [Rotaria sordida]
MGSGSSRASRASRASQFRTATTNPVTRVTIRETSVQTSTLNLRAQASEVSHSAGKSIKQDVSVQTSTLNLRAIEQKTNEKQLKLLPEIKLVPNRTRTLIEDDDHTRQELITNIKYRQYMDNNCHDVRSIAELVQKVPGFVKENWFRIGDALQQATHVWNAVKLSNYWYLLDATWGAGSGNEKKIEEFYFLTSPDQMIYTHLPTEDLWQLLSPSITKQQFLDLPLVKSTYYRLNLKLISPKQCVIETNQSLFEVIIKTPSPDITLTTTMKVGGDEYPDFHQLCQYDNTTGMTRCYFSPTNDAHRLFPTQVTSTENERTFPDVHLAIIEQRSFLDLNIKRHS